MKSQQIEEVKAQPVEILGNEGLANTGDQVNGSDSIITETPKNEVLIMGNSVCLNQLLLKLNSAKSDAGRIEKLCLEKGIVSKRKMKSIQGTGVDFVDLAAIMQANKAGLIQGKPEKVKARIEAIKGLNMLIDALTLLGLAERKASFEDHAIDA